MRPSVLFLSHPEKECGVHEFGCQVFEALRASERYRFAYQEIRTPDDLRAAVAREAPAALIVNWHPLTLRGVPLPEFRAAGRPVVGLLHEVTDEIADGLRDDLFPWYITHDPTLRTTNPRVFRGSRPLLAFAPAGPPPAVTTVGTFGFATPGKGFEGLVARVQAEFDECVIRMSIPHSSFCDADGAEARRVAARCRSLLYKRGIRLEVSHEFRSTPQVLEFLAGNSLNAFFYESQTGRGISSAVDLALAAGRPIALRRTPMFRHLHQVTPSIFVEDNSLREILRQGTGPLEPLRQTWTSARILMEYEGVMDLVLGAARAAPPARAARSPAP